MTNKTTIGIVVLLIAVVALLGLVGRPAVQKATTENAPIEVSYACNGGKTIDATLYSGETKPPANPGEPPIPGGRAHVALSDGRTLDLAQTISADGVRYANADDSLVFWTRGNGALVLEHNQNKSYIGCVRVAPVPAGSDLVQTYHDGQIGFSIRLPQGYAIDSSYAYQELGPGKTISGAKFTIPAAVATGTNLADDTYISVEEAPRTRSAMCSAAAFLEPGVHETTVSDDGVDYSVATSTGAGAGNRYEETVYALPDSNPCLAVRYFVHYGVIENYPAGAVREFDRDALLAQFDAIRRTLVRS